MYPALHIVVADDDQDDLLFFKEAVSFLHVNCLIETCPDGSALLEFLAQRSNWPNLIVLDLNMPRVDGFQVLKTLSEENALRNIPVFVMTTSYSPADLDKCEYLGCSGVFTKPFDLRGYAGIINKILKKLGFPEIPTP